RGDRERALREFRAGAAINPGFDSLVRASDALAAAGDVPGAWALLERARQLGPGRPELSTAKGRILLFTGRPEEAAVAFRQAIAQNPSDSRALAGLGEILLDHNDLGGAITVLSQALALDPDATSARNSLGIAYALRGQNDRAVAEFERVVRESPSPDFVANLAPAPAALAASRKERHPRAVDLEERQAPQPHAQVDQEENDYNGRGHRVSLPGRRAALQSATRPRPGRPSPHAPLRRPAARSDQRPRRAR